MLVSINGIKLDVPPNTNPFGPDYKYHKVVKSTQNAYMVEVFSYGRFGCHTYYKWVGKRACKMDDNGDVFVPVWLVE